MESYHSISFSKEEMCNSTTPNPTSSFLTTSIPSSSFYKCYVEQCKTLQLKPLKVITQQKADVILDIKADKITSRQWIPILNALEIDSSLYIIAIRSSGCYGNRRHLNSKQIVYRLRRHSSLHTFFTMNSMWSSLSYCLDVTETLTYLELDGITLGGNVQAFLNALKRNKTIRVLSIKNCDISSSVCLLLCTIIQKKWNIRELNLTDCSLDVSSAEHIAGLIKFQHIERCIRISDRIVKKKNEKKMAGLKAITLKKNPKIGDEGLSLILNALFDDLWIEVLDMQSCGITNKSAKDITNLVFLNSILSIADFRNNKLADGLAQNVYNTLKYKRQNLFSNLTYEKYLTKKYTKWTSIIPRVPSHTDLSTGNFFTRLFRKPKLPHSEDFEKREELLPERIVIKDFYQISESPSSSTNEDSLLYYKHQINLHKLETFCKAETSSENKDQLFNTNDSSDSSVEEEFVLQNKI